MGEPLVAAIGTNVTVGFFVGAAGVVGHLPGGVDWTLLGVGAAGVGSRRAARRAAHRTIARGSVEADDRGDPGRRRDRTLVQAFV